MVKLSEVHKCKSPLEIFHMVSDIREQGARVRSVKYICRIRGLGKRMDMYLTQLEPKSEVYALILI